jgi:hypothetical protein
MTHKKGTTVSDNLQTALLDERNFLTGIVHGCLQELIKSEFDHFINAQPHTNEALNAEEFVMEATLGHSRLV